MSAPATHLRPREHGAYAMLAFPVASGLLIGGASWTGVAFAVLAVIGFLAHEAVLVVLGRRGARVRSASDPAARTRLAVLGILALLSGVVFATRASGGTLIWAVPPAFLGLWVLGLVLAAGGTKTLSGELLVSVAFASVHAPVAAAGLADAGTSIPEGGASTAVLALPAVVWALSFALATLSVHALKARFRAKAGAEGGEAQRPAAVVTVAAPAAAAAALVLAGVVWLTGTSVEGVRLAPAATALVPKALLVLAVTALDVHPRHLKRVGWSLVTADTVTLGVLTAAF